MTKPTQQKKHEIWQDSEGTTSVLCPPYLNQTLAPDAHLIHTFYAASYYEAMTKYYKFMGFGTYRLMHEDDKKPYGSD